MVLEDGKSHIRGCCCCLKFVLQCFSLCGYGDIEKIFTGAFKCVQMSINLHLAAATCWAPSAPSIESAVFYASRSGSYTDPSYTLFFFLPPLCEKRIKSTIMFSPFVLKETITSLSTNSFAPSFFPVPNLIPLFPALLITPLLTSLTTIPFYVHASPFSCLATELLSGAITEWKINGLWLGVCREMVGVCIYSHLVQWLVTLPVAGLKLHDF